MKDNKLWFRAKYFGWGWTPITWQGWLLTILFAFYLVLTISSAAEWESGIKNGIFYLLLPMIVVCSSFFAICFMKGEKPTWRWGR